MSAYAYKIKCMTNLHVGSSEAGFGVVDKSVARDVVTNWPIVHASGLKGALREYFERRMKNGELNDFPLNRMFGTEACTGTGEESKPGELAFLPAELLALAVRASEGKSPYALATSRGMLALYNQRMSMLDMKGIMLDDIREDVRYRFSEDPVSVEGIQVKERLDQAHPVARLIQQADERAVVLTEDDLRDLQLPVIARNNLTAKRNLWYEEFVPHQSVFVFAMRGEKALLDLFDAGINGRIVQLGANASVGFGLCLVTRTGGSGDE